MYVSQVKKILGTHKEAKDKIQQIRLAHVDGSTFDSDLLRRVLRFHPTGKVPYACSKFRVAPDKTMKTPAIYFECSGTWDTVSTTKALKNLYRRDGPKYLTHDDRSDIIIASKNAFRREIRDGSRLGYLLDSTFCDASGSRVGVCACCSIRGPVDVDHKSVPFVAILDSFLEHKRYRITDVEVYKETSSFYRLVNQKMCAEWICWHDSRADYQLLCRACNCVKGKREM